MKELIMSCLFSVVLLFSIVNTGYGLQNTKEEFKNVTVFKDFVVTEQGHRLRTILTKPKSATERLPAILFIQWLSCDPVELQPGRTDGWSQMLRGVIERSGMVVMRTEKSGIGESEGPPCNQLDYNSEVAGHKAALQALQRSEHVDPNNIFAFGASMGGNMAPLVAQEENIRGILIWGTTSLTWAEHMIALDRRVFQVKEISPGEINEFMDQHIAFHTEYLIKQRTPEDIIAQNPTHAQTWSRMIGTGKNHHYGRSFAFHHQAQQANWEAAWGKVDAPVLVVHGEYDWIMAKQEHQRIIDIVNGNHPGRAELITLPKMDHHFEVYETAKEAFTGRGGRFDEKVLNVFLKWLERTRQEQSQGSK